MTTKTVSIKKVDFTELQKLEAKIAKMRIDAKKAKDAEKVLNVKLKEEAKQLKLEDKEFIAVGRVVTIKEALILKGEDAKINMTLKIKEMAMKTMTIDMMVKETGWKRKSILDRIWNIEKSLGLR